MQKIVITGNIGSGKSTIANIFKEHHVPIFDADAAIRNIYVQSDTFRDQIKTLNPDLISDNKVAKNKIIEHLKENPQFLDQLEGILYPLLDQYRDIFIQECSAKDHKMALFEVPLLFEKNRQDRYDSIILLYAPYKVRLKRTLKRPNMTREKFDFMNNRQIDYKEILDKVDLAIDTTQSKEICREIIEERFF